MSRKNAEMRISSENKDNKIEWLLPVNSEEISWDIIGEYKQKMLRYNNKLHHLYGAPDVVKYIKVTRLSSVYHD